MYTQNYMCTHIDFNFSGELDAVLEPADHGDGEREDQTDGSRRHTCQSRITHLSITSKLT